MADFDAQEVAQDDKNRIAYLEQNVQCLINQIQQLQSQPQPPLPTHPNLNLPTPPQFSGLPTEPPLFKLQLLHYLVGNQSTYHDPETQLLYASSLLIGLAG